MTEPAPPAVPMGAAVILGAALLLGLALLGVFGWVDRGRVADLEKFSETTAVGDHVYYALPELLPDPPIPVVAFQGRTLTPLSYEKFAGPEGRDTRMRAIARDPNTRLTIYQSRERLPNGQDDSYFVKTANNEYLQLRPSGAGH